MSQQSFVDTSVQPAVPMFYKFTVLTTDMSESAFSNVASAAAVDTIPPVVNHAAQTSAIPGQGLRLAATITDNVDVTGAAVHYRALGSVGPFTNLAMVNVSGTDWSVTIPGSAVVPPGVDYYLTATDGISTVYHGTPAAPHGVQVSVQPTVTAVTPNQGASAGGVTITVSGSYFQTGAAVYFDGQPASNVTRLTANQLTCVTPPHFPATVDVQLVNPDQTQATLFSGYQYVDTSAVVSLPQVSADHGAIVDVPLSLSNANGLRAAEVTVTFNSSVVVATNARAGTLTQGWSFISNRNTPGTVILSLAGASAVSGTGSLAILTFEVVGGPTTQTPLTVSSALLNDGAISCNLTGGSFTVNGLFTLAGAVQYFTGNGPVRGTQLSLLGVGSHAAITGATGVFSIADILTGAYTLTPTKDDDAVEITAYDASLVLQKTAGLLTLTTNQTVAADVNRNGLVNSMDASYILEASVGLRSLPFPGSGKIWDFVPGNRTYGLINGDLTGQNFTAVLLGDVSGNWVPPGGGAAAGDGPEDTATLSLPQIEAATGQQVHVPLTVERGQDGIYAADLVLQYDAAQLSLENVAFGIAAAGMGYAVNTGQPGVVRVGLAGAQPMAQDGTLLDLTFGVFGPLSDPAEVSLAAVRLNEGAVAATVQNGAVLDTTPPTAQFVQVSPDPRGTPVDSIVILFSEPVSGLDLTDLALVRDSGANLLGPTQDVVMIDSRTWRLEHLDTVTAAEGLYALTLNAAASGIVDAATNAMAAGAAESWRLFSGSVRGTPGDDLIRIVCSQQPGKVDVFINSPGAVPTLTADLTGFNLLTVTGEGGNDQLIVDFSRGNPLPSAGLSFDGGAGDCLTVRGTAGDDHAVMDGTSVRVSSSMIVGPAEVRFGDAELFTFALDDGEDSLVVSAATLRTNAAGSISDGTAVTITGGGVLDLRGATEAVRAVRLENGSIVNGVLLAAAHDLEQGTVSAGLAGTGGLSKIGDGTVTLSAGNGYAGGTAVHGGVLEVRHVDALPSGRSLTIGAGGTVVLASGLAVAQASNLSSPVGQVSNLPSLAMQASCLPDLVAQASRLPEFVVQPSPPALAAGTTGPAAPAATAETTALEPQPSRAAAAYDVVLQSEFAAALAQDLSWLWALEPVSPSFRSDRPSARAEITDVALMLYPA